MALIFGLPPISIFIFIFAGLLLGHLLWYRDTSALENRIGELEEDLAVAQGDASNQDEEIQSLSDALNMANGQLQKSQDELSDLHGHYEKLEAIAELSGDDLAAAMELEETRAELDAIRIEHDALRREFEDVQEANAAGEAAEPAQSEASEEIQRQAKMIESLTLTNSGQADEIERLEEQLRTLDSSVEVEDLRQQLALRDEQIEQDAVSAGDYEKLRSEFEEVDRQRGEASQKYASIVTSIETMQHQLAGALDQAERTADHNERLADLIEEKTARIEQLEQQLELAEQQLDDSDREVAEQSQTLEELDVIRGRLETSLQDLDDRDRLIESQRSEIQVLQGETSRLERYRQQFFTSDADLQTVLARMAGLRRELTAERATNTALRSLGRFRGLQQETHSDLQVVLDRLQQTRRQLADAEQQIELGNQRESRELAQLQQQLHTLDAACASALQESQLERAIRIEMEEKLSEKTTQIANLSRRCEAIGPLETKSDNLVRRVEEGLEEIERLTAELDESREGASELTAQMQTFESLQRDNITLAESLRANSQSMDELHTRLRDQHSQISVLKQRCDAYESLEDRCEDLEQKLETSRITIADFVAQLDEREVQIEELAGQNERFGGVHDDLQSALSRVTELERVEAGLAASLADQDREIESLRSKERALDEMKTRWDASQSELRDIEQARDELLVSAEEREQTLEAVREQLQQVTSENESLAGEVKAGEHRLIVAIKQSERLTSRLDADAEEIENLNRRLEAVADLEEAAADRTKEIKILQEQSSMQTRAYADQREELLRLRDALDATEITSQQLELTREQLDEANRERQTQVDENEKLRHRLQLLAEKSHGLVDALEESRQQLAEKTAQHEAVIQQFKQVQGGKGDVSALQADNQMLMAKVQDLVSHLRRVSVEHEQGLRVNENAQRTITKLQAEVDKQSNLIQSLRRGGGGNEGPRRAA